MPAGTQAEPHSVGGPPHHPLRFRSFGDVLRRLRTGMLGVDLIALLAILGALALGEHLVAAMVAVMVAGGAALEEFAEARAAGAKALFSRDPAHRAPLADEAICSRRPVEASGPGPADGQARRNRPGGRGGDRAAPAMLDDPR